jgi:hypothetical protein
VDRIPIEAPREGTRLIVRLTLKGPSNHDLHLSVQDATPVTIRDAGLVRHGFTATIVLPQAGRHWIVLDNTHSQLTGKQGLLEIELQ